MFDIHSPHDYLEMATENVQVFFDGVEEAGKAINAINSLNHLPEWVWKGWLRGSEPDRKRLGILDHSSWKDWVDSEVPHSKTIRALSNGIKHFDRQPITRKSGGWGRARWGQGRWGSSVLVVNINSGQGSDDAKSLSVSDAIRSNHDFWLRFFEQNRTLMNGGSS